MIRLKLFPLFDSYLIVIMLVVVILFVLWRGRLRVQQMTRFHRNVLFSLRLVVALLFMLAMLRPTTVFWENTKLPATFVILVDQSESMSIPDESGGRSRYDVACALLNSTNGEWLQFVKRLELAPYLFDQTVTPLTWQPEGFVFPELPRGHETAIGFSLQQVFEQTAGKRVIGTLLLTDGTQRALPPYDLLPQESAAHFRDNGCPLYAMSFGKDNADDGVRDIAVQDLLVNDRVFVENELMISGQFRMQGFAGHTVPLVLSFETSPGQMTEISRQEMTASSVSDLLPFQFRYAPNKAGLCKLTVSSPVQDGELLDSNNALSSFVHVMAGGINVLYIEGTWRTEQKYIRMALSASHELKVTYIRVPPGMQGILRDELQPGKYAAFILGDIDALAFAPGELEMLAARVREGAGLIMLGGYHAFGAGGYYNTPIAELCPVTMTPLDRQQPGAPIRDDLHLNHVIRMVPTLQGSRNYLMQLAADPQVNVQRWESLPPLRGANKLGRPKPGAIVLATTDGVSGIGVPSGISSTSTDHREVTPLLVTQTVGLGRVLAFAGDSTWQWWTHGFVETHKQFWRKVVLWLAKYDELLNGGCWVEIDKSRYLPGDTVTFRVRAKTKSGEEIISSHITVVVQAPDGKQLPVQLNDNNGIMTGTLTDTQLVGDYQINVTLHNNATADQAKEQTALARFMIQEENIELDNPVASPMLLDSIVTMTGGKMIERDRLPQLLDELTSQSEELVERHEIKKTLYDRWPFFLLLVAVLSTEWFLRKRWGGI